MLAQRLKCDLHFSIYSFVLSKSSIFDMKRQYKCYSTKVNLHLVMPFLRTSASYYKGGISSRFWGGMFHSYIQYTQSFRSTQKPTSGLPVSMKWTQCLLSGLFMTR